MAKDPTREDLDEQIERLYRERERASAAGDAVRAAEIGGRVRALQEEMSGQMGAFFRANHPFDPVEAEAVLEHAKDLLAKYDVPDNGPSK
jgi:hypothetical protein